MQILSNSLFRLRAIFTGALTNPDGPFQIVAIFRRVLPDVKPQVLANLLSVPALPPMDYSIVSVATKEEGDASFDPYKPCILDVFLACIAKALVVQIKTKLEEGGKQQVTLNLDQLMSQEGEAR